MYTITSCKALAIFHLKIKRYTVDEHLESLHDTSVGSDRSFNQISEHIRARKRQNLSHMKTKSNVKKNKFSE